MKDILREWVVTGILALVAAAILDLLPVGESRILKCARLVKNKLSEKSVARDILLFGRPEARTVHLDRVHRRPKAGQDVQSVIVSVRRGGDASGVVIEPRIKNVIDFL